MKTIGIFGGTFDPFHAGHLQMALSAKSILSLDEVRLVPCHKPPHRDTPTLTSEQRLHLLRLAIAGNEGLIADDREMRRSSPSWTVDTLKELRIEMGGETSITLLLGADSFSNLTHWHLWQELPKLAHIAVFLRPGYELPSDGILREWLNRSLEQNGSSNDLVRQGPCGHVLALDQHQINISATEIREQLFAGIMPSELDGSVRKYIKQNRLYGYKPK